ncbi:MAG: GNAT family N-acetyltransferase [Halobacteria archaeon]|nr:GNAT family N-acetyltransferase [Halobacteria archaeon]
MSDEENAGDRIRPLDESYIGCICEVTNSAAEVYYGTLPERCYSRPYMTREDVREDIEEGVVYRGYFLDSDLVGVIGVQEIENSQSFVAVRRLYVVPDFQRQGIGTSLLRHCLDSNPNRDVYTVTWKDAPWAVEFYEKNGFENLGVQPELVERHWSPPEGCENDFVVLLLES